MGDSNRRSSGRGRSGGKRGRIFRRDFRDNRENVWKRSRPGVESGDQGPRLPVGITTPWTGFVTENEQFENYYKAQKIVPAEEWDEFMSVFKRPLPATFRINGSGKFAYAIRDQMRRDFFNLLEEGVEVDGEPVDPPSPLPWYADNLAWKLNFSRMQLRKLPILGK
ncbi:hypothetical protein CBR_g12755 [Chara braunii]|uniref:Uncharacterized protein n=1 Tax=Chara braunii TaxID=69332 RepID=A0A388KSL2_CHABU|nr:hypothetical protein CBR_g12755 [Chara braunii]|eukprot:GBG73037.1 hypothetical protein CBR_g12755 [Chara braunii]